MAKIDASLLSEFENNSEYLKNSILSETDSKLKKFATEITKEENAVLRKELVKASNLGDFEDVIKQITNQMGLSSKEADKFKADMILEYEKYFNKAQLSMASDTDNKFMEITQQLTSGFETEGHGNDSKAIAGDLANALIKVSKGETKNKKIDIKNTNDMTAEMSLDYLKKEGNVELMNNIQNQYDISSNDKVKSTGDSIELLKKFDELNTQIIDEKKFLKSEYDRQHKVLESIDAKNDPEAYLTQSELLKEIEKSINYLNAIQADQLKQLKLKGATGAVNPKLLKTIKAEIEDTDKLNKSMDEATGIFGSMNKVSRSFGNQLSEATRAADAMADVFNATGSEMKSLGSIKGVADGFTNILSSGIISIGAFTAALGIAAKMVGMYHDQLNVSREMGDNSGGLVKDLQRMHINTLMDPGQLKALSDQIGGEFGVSLTRNQDEMQKVAVKQRLTERVMGKEYASDQMAALGQLKNVLEGTSPTAMMNTLANQTSALAKTMGISNKMALEQIKRLDENTKVLTQGLNKDMAAEIQKTFKEMEAGLVNAGMSTEAAAEITKASSEILADKDAMGKEQAKMITMINEGGAGGEAMKKAFADAGVSQTEAMNLIARTQLVGFNNLTKEEKAAMQKITAGSQIAQAVQMEEWQKVLDKGDKNDPEYQKALTKKMNADRQGYKANSDVANAVNKNKGTDKFFEKVSQGKEMQQQRDKGESATQDLNAVFIAMGANDMASRKKAMDSLIKALPDGDANKDLAKIMQEQTGLTAEQLAEMSKQNPEKYAQMQIDAYKTLKADDIKKAASGDSSGLGNIKTLKGGTLSGEIVKAAKEDKDFEKKAGKMTDSKVEGAQDTAEEAATKALYAMQNATMDLVNGAIDALGSALEWLTENIALVASALAGLGIAMVTFKYKDKISSTLSSVSGVLSSFGSNMTVGIAKAHTALFKGFGGIAKGVGGFLKDKVLGPISEKFGEMFGPLKEKLGNMFSGISEKFKGFSFGGGKGGADAGIGEPPDTRSFFQKIKDGVTKGVKGVGGALKGLGSGLKSIGGMVGPMALAGAAMKAFEGAMEGIAKAGEWFGSTGDLSKQLSFGPMVEKSKEDISKLSDAEKKRYYEDLANSQRAAKTAKELDPNARWDAEKKAYVDGNGEIIRSSAEKLKIQSDANQKLAESFSKTGTAIWNGTEYVDEYGRTIEASASFSEKAASGVGGALESLSFGMLDGQHMAHKTMEVFKMFGDWMDKNGISQAFKDIGSTMSDLWTNTLSPLVTWIGSVLSPIFTFMGQVFKSVFQYAKGIIQVFSGLWKILTLDFSGGFDLITDGLGSMLDGFYGLITGAFKAIGGILTNIPGLGWLGTAFTALGDALDWIASGIIAFVSNPVDMLGKAFTWIGDLFTSIKDAYVKVWTDIYNGTIGFLKNLWNTITGIFSGDLGLSDLGSLVKDTFNNIVDYIFAPIRWLADTIGGFFGVDLLKPIDGFITGVKTYFGSMVDGVMKYVGGLFDIVTAPFKAIMAWISGDLSFTDAMKQMFGSMIEGVKSMWSGFLDIVTAPFKGIISFIDSTFGTNIMGIFTSVIDSVTSIFGGFLDIVTAPFKGLIAWISGEMSLTEAFAQAWESTKAGLAKMFGGLYDMIVSPFKGVVKWITDKLASLGLADSDAEKTTDALQKNVTEKQKAIASDVSKKIGFDDNYRMYATEMDKTELAKKAEGLTNDEIKSLIAANKMDNDNIEQLAEILNKRESSGPKVEVKALPAKADGGSTGGLGDAFAQMVMPDLSKETPVATVGTDEFVFSKAMIEEFMKAKGAAGSPNSGAMSLGLPSGSGDAKSAEMKSKDAQKSNLKEQKKLQEEGIKKQTKEGIDDKQATSMVDTLKSLKDKLVGGATAAGGAVVDGAKSFATGYTDVGKSILSNVGDVLTGKKNPIEAISDVGTTLMDALPDSASNIIKGLGENVTSTITNLSSIGGSITDNFKGMLNGDTTLSQGIQNVGSEINNKAITPLKETFTSFGDKFSGMFGGLMDKVTSSPVFQKGKEIIGNVVDAGKGFMEKIAGFIHKSETGKSNGDYGAAKDIGDGAGISFGAYQLTEKSGGIKAFLDKMAADGDTKALELAKQFNKGGNAFGGNKADLTAYLKTAGNSDKGKAAQDEIYSKKYVEPAMKLAAEKGITDKAAIAQIVDHSVNAGVGGARRMLNKANGTSAEDVANARKADYNAIIAKDPSKAKYRKGWEGRVDNNSKAFKEYAGVDIGIPDKTNAKLYTSPNANVKPAIVASNDIKTKKSLNELTPNNGTTIPSSTSTKIASNNIVAKGTAQQMASTNTVNNTTNNNGSMDGKLVAQLVAINEKQLAHQTKMSQEAVKQTKQSQKDYKADIDRKDQARINEISTRKV